MKPIFLGFHLGAMAYRFGECNVLLSGPKERAIIGWHFSISHQSRNPTWEEQRDFRYKSDIPPDIYMVSILPPKSEYVNIHPFCFHWHEAGPKMFDVSTGQPLL
jgi:hypothetical protein